MIINSVLTDRFLNMVLQNAIRSVHTCDKMLTKVIPKNLKGKKVSSQNWLIRQLEDPYIEKAKMLNYRCRSAFKLIEMDDRLNLLKPGKIVVDCGAAPGSWTQVAVKRTNSDDSIPNKPSGIVIAMDKLQIYPITGAHILGNMDFTALESQNKIREILNDKKVDIVLSDMAPNATGVKVIDQESILNLCYCLVRFTLQISNINGNILMKIWDGGGVPKLESDLRRFYDVVKVLKPLASRTDSSEKFILGKGFKGLKTYK